MKPYIKKRLLEIARKKIDRVTSQYPTMTGGYLTPIEVKLLLESGYVVSSVDYDDTIQRRLKDLRKGISNPINVYFYNERADKEYKAKEEMLAKLFKL